MNPVEQQRYESYARYQEYLVAMRDEAADDLGRVAMAGVTLGLTEPSRAETLTGPETTAVTIERARSIGQASMLETVSRPDLSDRRVVLGYADAA